MSSPTILSKVPVLSLPNDVSSALALTEGSPEAGECFGVNRLTAEFIRGSVGSPMAPSAAHVQEPAPAQ